MTSVRRRVDARPSARSRRGRSALLAPALAWLHTLCVLLASTQVARGADEPLVVRPVVEDPVAPIGLEDVLRSVDAHFPTLHALRAEASAREQDLRAERGRFDLQLALEGDVRPLGFYESRAAGASLEQPSRLRGSRFFAGYRIGAGDVPSYQGGRITNESGELSAGVEIPLLRGGAIDPARGAIARSEIALRQMTPAQQLERLEVIRAASLAYWDFVSAGRGLEVAERLVAVAEERQTQIARRVEAGAEPRIDLTDNRRLIVERSKALRGAERDFEQAALQLSLFLRDDAGRPRRADRSRVPIAFPAEVPLSDAAVDADLAFARTRHPILAPFALERERLQVDLRLARNDALPNLDLRVEGAQDLGGANAGIDEVGKLSDDPRGSSELMASVRLALPVQRRQALGRAAAAQARLSRVAAREQLARERVEAEARAAVAALSAAYDQTGQARENVELARTLREAEARRFGLGRSNLIDVNIRERQAASASLELVEAQASYFRALADYSARVGRPLQPDGTEGQPGEPQAQPR